MRARDCFATSQKLERWVAPKKQMCSSFVQGNENGRDDGELMEMMNLNDQGRDSREPEVGCFQLFCEQQSKLPSLLQRLSFRWRRPSRLKELFNAAAREGAFSKQVLYFILFAFTEFCFYLLLQDAKTYIAGVEKMGFDCL